MEVGWLVVDRKPRVTAQRIAILGCLLQEPQREQYGLKIAERLGLKTGTVYPILAAFVEHGWLLWRWEDIDPVEEQRPPRKLYQVAPGQRDAVATFVKSYRRPIFAAATVGPANQQRTKDDRGPVEH